MSKKIAAQLRPSFQALGLELDRFMIENVSMPDELQKVLDERIGMNMAGDLGRYTQFQAAQALRAAAGNPGGAAGAGVGLGAAVVMAQSLLNPGKPVVSPAVMAGTRYCTQCGQAIPKDAKFCWECGKPQQ